MDFDIQRKLLDDYIPALFPGVDMKEEVYQKNQSDFAVYARGQSEIRIKSINDKAVLLHRAQHFTSQEKKLVNDLVAIAYEYSELPKHTQYYLNANSLTRAVARSLANNNSDLETHISLMLDTLEEWSAQTYEGSRIATSFGIDTHRKTISDDFNELSTLDLAKVLTNGYDTLMEFSSMGKLIKYEALKTNYQCWSAPFRYGQFCKYTRNKSKYAFVLNRNGEILIFSNGELVYAKRRGAWRLFSHESVIKQMAFSSKSFEEDVRKAIYETMLDVSFARSGGCIGYVQKSMYDELMKDKVIRETEMITDGNSFKAGILRDAASKKPFKDLDRRLRQELVAIDGATIINHEGKTIAVGAILTMPQDEEADEGGARLRAAKCLRKYGMSSKISADGEIRVFGKKDKEFKFA